jgi:hypothetical protein
LTGERQQPDVRRLRQAAGDLPLQGPDFLGFALPVVIKGQGQAVMLGRGDVAGSGLFGPVEDSLGGALLEAEAGLT